jgi:hypothetical protein
MGILDDIEDVADQMANSRAPTAEQPPKQRERRTEDGQTVTQAVDSMSGQRTAQSTDSSNGY